jgi:homoserine O-acetyltransferase
VKLTRTVLACALLSPVLWAQDGSQQFASLGDFRLESGETIRDCRLGYRTYGKLNAGKSNAVLFPTWFTGNTEEISGHVGSGKLVDGARHFVILVDAIGNGVSSAPSNSRRQPRMRFPRFSIRDMVESQRRLLTEVFGINHLRAVIGISMGGMQAFEWMVAYPDFMDIAIPIVGSPKLTAYDLLLWEAERHAIEADAAWRNGNYRQRPVRAMRTVANIHDLALSTPAKYVRDAAGKNLAELRAQAEKARLEDFDTNDWYRQLEAMIGHDVSKRFGGDMARAAAAVKARALIIVGLQDHMVVPQPAIDFARRVKAATVELDSDCGHLVTNCEAAQISEAVARMLQ